MITGPALTSVQALLLDRLSADKLVQDCVRGVMFFGVSISEAEFRFADANYLTGTPHNGSDIAATGKILATLVSKISPLNAPRALLGMLRKNSQELFEMTEDFVKRRGDIELVAFYETRRTRVGCVFKTMVRPPGQIIVS